MYTHTHTFTLKNIRLHTQAQSIHSAIAAAEHDAALTAEGHQREVPHTDVRPEAAQAADDEVVQQVCVYLCTFVLLLWVVK